MSSSLYELRGNTALYEVLGVPCDASAQDIRRAYYKLAVLYHPDKNADGEEIFKEVCFAHSILSDPAQRAMYDKGTLRGELQCRAREYDPAMDPTVELSAEELRRFVERVRGTHDAAQQRLSAFEQRREEEMRRRAEYDATHPGVKAEYEQLRQQRLQRDSVCHNDNDDRQRKRGDAALHGAYTSATDARRDGQLPRRRDEQALTTQRPFRTTAQLVADLQQEEQQRLYGVRTAAPSLPARNLSSIKQQMMSQYYGAHADDSAGNNNSNSSRSRCSRDRVVATTSQQCGDATARATTPSYSEHISERLRTHANFDYLTFVEKDMVDGGGIIEDAILADALGLYDRHH